MEQAVHGARREEVSADFLDDAELRGGEGKREARMEPPHQLSGSRVARAGLGALGGVLRGDGHLHAKKLGEHEVAPGLLERGPGIREMDLAQHGGARGRVERPWEENGGGVRGKLLEEAVDDFAQHACGEPFGGAVNRHDTLKVQRRIGGGIDDLKLGALEDDQGAAAFRAAIDDQFVPDADGLLDPRLIEPAGEQARREGVRAGLLQVDLEEPEPPAQALELRLEDDAADAAGGVAFLRGKMVELRAVLVASRVVGEEVAEGVQTGALELAMAVGGNRGDLAQRGVEGHRSAGGAEGASLSTKDANETKGNGKVEGDRQRCGAALDARERESGLSSTLSKCRLTGRWSGIASPALMLPPASLCRFFLLPLTLALASCASHSRTSLYDRSHAKKLTADQQAWFGPGSGALKYDSRMIRAAQLAASRASEHSTAQCWRSVKSALVEANAVDSRPKTEFAKEAGAELETSYGFQRINVSDPYAAPIGSVLVYGGHGAGHVEMRTPAGFVSDFTSIKPSSRPLIGVYVKPHDS